MIFCYICRMKQKKPITEMGFDTEKFIPGQSVDCVIVGFDKEGLKILILRWKLVGLWGLPGGFVLKSEDLDKAATRVLNERVGISLPFLQQFHTFGKKDRRANETRFSHLSNMQVPQSFLDWFEQRFISTGYVSLVNLNDCDPKPDELSDLIHWCPLHELPDLIYDHSSIVEGAIDFIRNQINYLPIGRELLPEKFTMKELQQLYESILEKKLDRGNFQRKMLKLEIFIRHEKHLEGGAHKAPYLYSFDGEKYDALLKKGIGFAS